LRGAQPPALWGLKQVIDACREKIRLNGECRPIPRPVKRLLAQLLLRGSFGIWFSTSPRMLGDARLGCVGGLSS
jgi:hypothetical protein